MPTINIIAIAGDIYKTLGVEPTENQRRKVENDLQVALAYQELNMKGEFRKVVKKMEATNR